MIKSFQWRFLLVLLCFPLISNGAETSASRLWIREAPPNAPVLAAYGTIMNPGDTILRLIAVESSAFEDIQFHQTTTVYGVSRMRAMESIEIPAAGKVHLEPGGTHLMLIKPVSAIRAGMQIELTFISSSQQRVSIIAEVVKGHPDDHHHH